jgi:hypothetical protein
MSDHKWNDNHGEDKLYSNTSKFEVYRRKSDTELVEKLGEDGELIFGLHPERDKEAFDALLCYTVFVRHRSPGLADQLRDLLAEIAAEQDGLMYNYSTSGYDVYLEAGRSLHIAWFKTLEDALAFGREDSARLVINGDTKEVVNDERLQNGSV